MSFVPRDLPHALAASESPRVSIIVTCYNLGGYLSQALRSVCGCDARLVETIIIDDGSSHPATVDVLGALKQNGWRIVHQENKGVSAARNAGIALARGEYILPLDADNRIRPDYPLRGTQLLDDDPQIGIVYGDCELFGRERGRRNVPDFDLHRLHLGNFIDVCALFRKKIWAEVGGFDEDLQTMGHEDWDFWLSVADRGWKFHHLADVMFDYRVRAGSMSAIAAMPTKYESLVRYLSQKHRYFVDHHAEITATLNRTIVEYRDHYNEASRYARSLKRALDARKRQFLEAERYAKSLEAALAATEAECSRLKEALTTES